MTNEQLLKKINLVVDKLMNLDLPELSDNISVEEQFSRGLIKRDFGIKEWDWPQGVGLYGIYKLNEYYKEDRYKDFFENWYKENLKKGLPSKNINTTAPYLTLVDLLDKLENPVYEQLCLEQAQWLMDELPRTKEGGFQHVTSAVNSVSEVRLNEGELWIDTLFMAVLFLNKMGQRYKNQEWVEESIRQVLIHIKYLYDKKSGLFYHGWSFLENGNFGEIFWCRGNSWFTFGIMDYIDSFQGTMGEGLKAFLTDTFKAQVNALIKRQAPSGLWRTVLTDETSYEEVSGSAAIATGILKGIKSGILDASYQSYADKAVAAICENIDEKGTVLNVSSGTAMGYSADHYKNIVIAPMAYGQSLTLVALCEALK